MSGAAEGRDKEYGKLLWDGFMDRKRFIRSINDFRRDVKRNCFSWKLLSVKVFCSKLTVKINGKGTAVKEACKGGPVMAQTMEECLAFLNGARDALDELSLLAEQEEQLSQEEERLEKSLEEEKKRMADTIQQTVKQRRDEIGAAYEKEISKAQEQLRKVRSRREKAKNEGMKERIANETAAFREEIRDLKLQLKSLMKRNHVPGYCQSTLYYTLYFPCHVKEYLALLVFALLFFLAVPWGIYQMIPERKPLWLMVIYLADILLVGGGYMAVGNKTKLLHMEALRDGRKIQDQILANKKKIQKTTTAVRKDRNESLYNLDRFDDEIARLQQELSDVTIKQKDAINTFETVTKNILTDEIEHNYKAKLEQEEEEYQRATQELRRVRQHRKEKQLSVTSQYGTYLGNEFMDSQKIMELCDLVRAQKASNISEAISVYKSQV